MVADETLERRSDRYGSRIGIEILHFVLKVMGLWAVYACLWFVVAYYLLFRPSARKSTYPYLRRRFPSSSWAGLYLGSFKMMLELARSITNQAAVVANGPELFSLEVDGQSELAEILSGDRAVVLLLAHVGGWKTAIPMLNVSSKPVRLLVFQDDRSPSKGLDRSLESMTGARSVDPTGAFGGLLEATSALMRGEIVGIMGDRMWGGDGTIVSFLGEECVVPDSPYRIALATDARVVSLLIVSDEYRKLRIHFREIDTGDGLHKNRKERCRHMAQQYVNHIEQVLQDHPYSWFNFFDFWQMEQTG